MEYACQLYSCRGFQPWETVLAMLADAGYALVEGYPDIYGDAAAFADRLAGAGLRMPSGHFPVDQLEESPARVAEIAATLGIGQVYCPYLEAPERPVDRAGWAAFAHRLEAVGGEMKKYGLSFGWHNHDFEFEALPDGTLPMEVLLEEAPGLGWEADIAWIARAGADPRAWIDRHGGRITAVHVKDIAAEGAAADEDGWADVGYGILDWPSLLDRLRRKTRAELYVAEHDNPSDVARFARRSIGRLKGWRG